VVSANTYGRPGMMGISEVSNRKTIEKLFMRKKSRAAIPLIVILEGPSLVLATPFF